MGHPALLIAATYFYTAYLCTLILDRGGPSGIYLQVLLFLWNAMKLISLMVLARVRLAEARQHRDVRQACGGEREDTSTTHR